MSIRNDTAAPGVGARHGSNREGHRQAASGSSRYHETGPGSTIVGFRPRRDAILIEYAVTHWRVSRLHAASGERTVLGSTAAIVTAAAYARDTARRYGTPIILGPGATGWRHLVQVAA